MFLGQYQHTIDEKNRLTLPSRFRGELEGGVVVTRGIEHCLWIFPEQKWAELAATIDSLTLANRDSRAFSRLMFSGAVDVVPDRQGRVRIPDYLLRYAGIDGDVVVVGLNSKIEVWSRESWAVQEAYIEENPEGIAAQLNDLGI